MKIVLNYDFDNWNLTINKSRSNYYYANNQKKKEMEYVEWELINQKIQPIEKYPIKLFCYWHCKNRQSDLDNKSLKSVLDAMQNSGILKNDNMKHITEIHHYYVSDKENKLEIIVEQV